MRGPGEGRLAGGGWFQREPPDSRGSAGRHLPAGSLRSAGGEYSVRRCDFDLSSGSAPRFEPYRDVYRARVVLRLSRLRILCRDTILERNKMVERSLRAAAFDEPGGALALATPQRSECAVISC